MPRFQSRLFNWIDQSLPAQLGRSVRRSLDQKFRQLAGLSIQELPRLFAYQVAKAALYPIYLIASTAKRVFPALARSKDEPREKLRSQPKAAGLLSEAEVIAENIKNKISPEPAPKTDLADLNGDFPKPEIPLLLRSIAKFLEWIDRTKTRLDRNIAAIVKRKPDNLATLGDELETKVIANRIFAEIWRQQIEQKQAEQNSLKESNGLAENVALGKNTRLEQLQSLIEAAIAYFFGKHSNSQDQSLPDNKEVVKDSSQPPTIQTADGELKKNAPLAESSNLDRLRDLIAAAIDYFIGKRSLDGDQDERNDQTLDITPSEEAWLTMEDIFGNDNGPWPHPLEYESIAFSKSPDRTAIHSSGELQNFETTTTQITQDQLQGSLIFEEEVLTYPQQSSDERDRPLRAWIETKATLLGYVYNPVMTVILWVDAIILTVENLIINIWKGLISFPRRLINFIRYGKKRF